MDKQEQVGGEMLRTNRFIAFIGDWFFKNEMKKALFQCIAENKSLASIRCGLTNCRAQLKASEERCQKLERCIARKKRQLRKHDLAFRRKKGLADISAYAPELLPSEPQAPSTTSHQTGEE